MGVRDDTGLENAHFLRCETWWWAGTFSEEFEDLLSLLLCSKLWQKKKTFHGKTRRQNELLQWGKEPKDKKFSSPEQAERHSVKKSFDKSGGFSVTETEKNHFLNVITLLRITFFLHSHKSDVLRLWSILEFKLPSLLYKTLRNTLELSVSLWPWRRNFKMFHSDNQWHQDHTLGKMTECKIVILFLINHLISGPEISLAKF